MGSGLRVNGHRQQTRGDVQPLHQEDLADVLASSVLCLKVNGKQPEYQYGYLIAPHLVVTAWHPRFPTSRQTPDVSILHPGFPGSAAVLSEDARVSKILAANSQADCALLRIDPPLRHKRHLRLGSFKPTSLRWEQVQSYLLQKEHTSPLGSLKEGTLGRFTNVQPELGQPVHELTLAAPSRSDSGFYYRGSPVISLGSGLCLGHISQMNESALNQFWICPASAIAQLNPELVRTWHASGDAQNTSERLHELRRGGPACVQILTSRESDKLDIEKAVELLGLADRKFPLIEVVTDCIPTPHGPKALPVREDARVVLLLLDEEICKYSSKLPLGRDEAGRSRSSPLFGCVVADRLSPSAEPFLRGCTLHLSAERPLRWIFDRSRRLSAWMQLFHRLELLILRAVDSLTERP